AGRLEVFGQLEVDDQQRHRDGEHAVGQRIEARARNHELSPGRGAILARRKAACHLPLCARISPTKRANRQWLSRGPGEASGWYCTENTGLSLSASPQFEPSNSETWVCSALAGSVFESTAKPWFIEVISTLPVVRSFTGWFAP